METVARDDFFESLLGDFLDESGQLLDRLNENLLQLDEWVRALDPDHQQRCSDELMNEMFRSAHSLKGLSAMLGLKEINGLTHRVENVFDAARKDELIVTGDVVELMFQAVDRLGGLVETLKEPTNEPIECESVLQGINRLLESAGVARGPSTQADAERALAAATAELAQAAATSPPPATAEPSAQACSSAETPASEPMAETPAPVAAAAVPTENPPVEAAPQRGVPWEDSPTECELLRGDRRRSGDFRQVPGDLHRRDRSLSGRAERDPRGHGGRRATRVAGEATANLASHQGVGGLGRTQSGGQAGPPDGRSPSEPGGAWRNPLARDDRRHAALHRWPAAIRARAALRLSALEQLRAVGQRTAGGPRPSGRAPGDRCAADRAAPGGSGGSASAGDLRGVSRPSGGGRRRSPQHVSRGGRLPAGPGAGGPQGAADL